MLYFFYILICIIYWKSFEVSSFTDYFISISRWKKTLPFLSSEITLSFSLIKSKFFFIYDSTFLIFYIPVLFSIFNQLLFLLSTLLLAIFIAITCGKSRVPQPPKSTRKEKQVEKSEKDASMNVTLPSSSHQLPSSSDVKELSSSQRSNEREKAVDNSTKTGQEVSSKTGVSTDQPTRRDKKPSKAASPLGPKKATIQDSSTMKSTKYENYELVYGGAARPPPPGDEKPLQVCYKLSISNITNISDWFFCKEWC